MTFAQVETLRREYDAQPAVQSEHALIQISVYLLAASIEEAPAQLHLYTGSSDAECGNQTCGGGRRVIRKRIGGR